MIGTHLGHYQITASLGAGGMGEVFRARDTQLDRDVAIKVLPKTFASDPDRLRRFQQESKTLAALNHPNVLTIHDAGVHEGAPYLVSELLEGRTLREVLVDAKGAPLAVRKATDYALQIAHGLAAAHSKGIIHRDLKPENIFVTADGRVKILDFGLAKLTSVAADVRRLTSTSDFGPRPSDSSRTSAATEPGLVFGTPNYMSPEQVRGEPADHRSDIFSFGCVLYEMLTGVRAFRRDTPVECMSAILNDSPQEIGTTHPQVPLGLTRLVERCLEKQPDNRFQSAKDLAFALESLSSAREKIADTTQRAPASWLWPICAVGVLLISAVGAWLWINSHNAPGSPTNSAPAQRATGAELEKSVAVRPFDNHSADKADDYLSDGFTDELLNALMRIKGLRVPGRSSSFAFKGKTEQDTVRKMGEQLKVRHVLEGSVSKSGEKLRIAADLVNVADGFSLWSETYDRDMTNIFAIQSDIAARVADALRVQLLGEGGGRKDPTTNLEAYKLYLKGRQLWSRRTGSSLTEAIAQFEQAIGMDASYALAYSGLADCYTILEEYSGVPARATFPKARVAAMKAIELDKTLGEPHAALGHALGFFDWDWAGAEREFQNAIRLNPVYPFAHHWYAANLEAQSRFPEALDEENQAHQLDPLSPIINATVAELLLYSGKLDPAIEALKAQLDRDPQFFVAHYLLGQAYLALGRNPEALTEFETADKIFPNNPMEWCYRVVAYTRTGRRGEAEAILTQLRQRDAEGLTVGVPIALVEHALGRDTQALDALDKAADQHDSNLLTAFSCAPLWADLRQQPRGQALLKRMKLRP